MGIHSLTNVPTAASKVEIRTVVDGENVMIVSASKYAEPDDYLVMTSTFIGNHMMAKPDDLRRMYASDLAIAIALARDAGYHQAKAEIRDALGIARF
jgi:hypothetical protein